MTTLRIYAEEGHSSRITADQLFESGKNWFIGWKCLAGTTSLAIDHEGNIFSAHCKSLGTFGRQGSYGNIFTEFYLEKGPVKCARRFCESEFDLTIPKYHRPKHAELLNEKSTEDKSVEKPVAIIGDHSIQKRVHWNVSAFELRSLSEWKDCAHKLEIFFKGATGRIILQDPRVQSSDFALFLEFLTIEKGHEVTLEHVTVSSQESKTPELKETVRLSQSGVKILLFIPMRNCSKTISKVISGLDKRVLQHVNEILILDNDSSDESMKTATEAARSIHGVKVVIRKNEKNYGFGGSHKLALQYAHLHKMDYVLVVHGDNSGSPADFCAVLNSGEFREFDLVMSSRLSLTTKRENYPFYRFVGNWLINLLASIVTFSKVTDYSGGPVSLYRVQTFINKYDNPMKNFSDRISFAQDAFLFVSWRRGKVKFVPVSLREAGGKSLYSALSQFAHSVIKLVSYRFR